MVQGSDTIYSRAQLHEKGFL